MMLRLFVFAACVGFCSTAGVAQTNEIRLGHIKAGKILFLGNSITAVPQQNKPIWWGLSASSVAKDYVHLLVGAIDAKTGGHLTLIPTTGPTTNADGTVDQCDSNVINIADVFERGYASYTGSKIRKQLAWQPDIVILQFGENIPPATFNAEVFKTSLRQLMADLKAGGNPHVVVPSHILGANPTVDAIKRDVCAEDPARRVFVDLGSVAKDPANMGAYGHPGDKGMALIAETLFQALLAHSTSIAPDSSNALAAAAGAGVGTGVGKFFSLDSARVKVGGEMGRRIDLTINSNLLAIEVDNQFLKPFRQKQSHAFDYIGLGKLIDATVSLARYSKDPRVLELKDRLINELIATQLDDGYIGSFPAGTRIRDIFDEHEIAYNLHALVNDYRKFNDQPSLDAARKLADYVLKNYQAAIATRDPKLVCKIDIERAFIALSEATGDSRYRDYIVDREKTRQWNPPIDLVNNGQYSSAEGHAYTFMNLCLAQLDLYREQPDPALLAQSRRVMTFLTENDGLMISGTCSLTERFRDNQETRGDVGESCATAYLIRMAHHRLQLEGKTLDADLIERAIYNALFAAQSPDGRSLRYYTAIDSPRKYHPIDTYCCPGNWRRIVGELPEMICYRSADGGVLVNLYTTSTVDVPIANGLSVQLRQETDYPNSGKVLIKVDPSRSAEFPVALRIPRWCESAALSVNGLPAASPAKPGEWTSVRRLWKPGDVVTLEMPITTRLVRGRKLQAGKVAVMRGPVLFCLSPSVQAARYPVYAGHGANPAEIQRSVEEALSKTRFDWSTLAAPVPDKTIRPGGLALEVRAWGPASDRSKPADLTLRLTEFIDPTGQLTYLPCDNPKATVEDELCVVPAAR